MISQSKRFIPFISLALIACEPAGGPGGKIHLGEVGEVEESSPLGLTFEDVAERWAVPVDVLKAYAFVETQLEAARGEVEFDDQPEPWGLFGLRGEELDLAAELAGHDAEAVRTDDGLGIDAMGALLAHYADRAGIDDEAREDPMAWGPALALSGGLDAEMAEVHSQEILSVLERGVAVPMADGTNLVVRRHGDAEVVGEFDSTASGLGASGVLWRPSPNHSSRNGSRVEMVIIHTCEGSYSGCVSWLRQSRARASAHYVIKENGSEVSQLVDENRRAWHVAASYRKRLNSNKISHREGRSVNDFSIGIEHGGSARQRSFPTGQIDRSVSLVRSITARHNIPRDRYHIVGHGQLQPESRSDPGPNWPWSTFLRRISTGSSTPPPSNPPSTPPPSNPPTTSPPNNATVITVDNTTSGRFSASGAWEYSAWASGRVGANYRFHAPQERSDTAKYKINIPARGRYEVFARVPGNGYNTSIPYIIDHRGGRAIVTKNVKSEGAKWLSLGTYEFDRKDDWIFQISVWTGGRGWIIADAVRFVKR